MIVFQLLEDGVVNCLCILTTYSFDLNNHWLIGNSDFF